MPTTIAGKYEVLEQIGGGGQGTVYRVRHLFLEEIRALKVQTDPGEGGDSAVRVLREGRALARLRHPNIVQVFDLGRDGAQHYLEMEYVDGPNLAQRLKQDGRLPLDVALAIGRQIAGALAYAHAQPYVDSRGVSRTGMIHRDVKPSNILLRRGALTQALLADFGLVKIGDGSDRTQLGTLMGTYRYSAPEQLGYKRDGQRAPIDHRADLFSLGLVLYEMLEGRPFHGTVGSEEVIARLLLDRDPLVPQFSTPLDPELTRLIGAMVARHPDDRVPGGMAEVVRVLDDVIARPAREDAFPVDDLTRPLEALVAAHEARQDATASRGATQISPPTVVSPPPPPPAGPATVVVPPRRDPVPPPREPPPPPRPPRDASPPRREDGPPPARSGRSDRIAVWPWLVAGAVLVAIVAVALLGRAPSLPPLRFASVEPPAGALRVAAGEDRRFAVVVGDADRYHDLGIDWHVDGRRAGHGASFTFRPDADDQGASRKVEVIAQAGEARASEQWTVTVPAVPTTLAPVPTTLLPVATTIVVPPTMPPETVPPVPATVPPTLPPVVSGPPRIASRTPATDGVGVMAGQGVEFTIEPEATPSSHRYTYAWFLDGRPAGTERTFRYKAPQTPPPASQRVEAEIRDEHGVASERVVWRVDVRSGPPRITETVPRAREVRIAAGETTQLTVRAVPGRSDAPLRYEWRIDRLPARISKQGVLAVPDDLTTGKHTIEVIAVDDVDDRRSQPFKWTIIVEGAAAVRPPTPPVPDDRGTSAGSSSGSSGARVTEAEARQWVDRLRSAWERRDRNVLRDMGELPASGKVSKKVTIGEASIILDAAGATVWWDHVEDGASTRSRARLVRDPSGRVIRR